MILNLRIDQQEESLDVPDDLIQQAQDFFEKMDNDMNKGWQMSQKWVEKPNNDQRCQIAADKILIAIDTKNSKMMMLMAAYILNKMPEIKLVDISTNGDMHDTTFEF